MKLPFQDADPAHRDFQFLEDLSTAYWYSEVLFTALELNLFEFLEQGSSQLNTLARVASCHAKELHRLLKVLERLELVHHAEGVWFNSQIARKYLVPGGHSYIGDFLLYRRYIQPKWKDLVQRISFEKRGRGLSVTPDDDYAIRTFHYVRAMDELMQQKAEEIMALLALESWEPPILDVGGGAGALSRSLIKTKEHGYVLLFELPEVIRAAKTLHPDKEAWKRFQILKGDFRTYEFQVKSRFGLIVMSNFLHAYGEEEARKLLYKALTLLEPDGLILIHDYFPDRLGQSPQKAPLYDLNMMINTFNGRCHEGSQIMRWLREAGVERVKIRDLATDSSIVLATREKADCEEKTDLEEWVDVARAEGFCGAFLLPTEKIIMAPWVHMKCRFGCGIYCKNLQCPPNGMDIHAAKEMIESYT